MQNMEAVEAEAPQAPRQIQLVAVPCTEGEVVVQEEPTQLPLRFLLVIRVGPLTSMSLAEEARWGQMDRPPRLEPMEPMAIQGVGALVVEGVVLR